MKFNKRSLLLFGTICGSFLLGAAFMFLLFRARPELAAFALGNEQKRVQRQAEDPFAAARQQLFGGGEDPFAAMEEMEKRFTGQGFAGLMQLQGGDDQSVVEREDETSIYFEISGVDQSKLSTRVENGYLTIKGESKKLGGQQGGFSATMQSSFQRTFPLPPNVDEKKMEMSSEKDKVILRFPKRS